MPYPEVQILVCANERPPDAEKPSCGPRGGAEVYRRLKDAIRVRGLRDRMIVTRTGGLKHCSHGVTVGVWPRNLWSRGVTPGDIAEILDAAACSDPAGPGRAVERLRLPEDTPFE
jgi:(2Fe-2S) ferredoxin